jgi:hypothetical protein
MYDAAAPAGVTRQAGAAAGSPNGDARVERVRGRTAAAVGILVIVTGLTPLSIGSRARVCAGAAGLWEEAIGGINNPARHLFGVRVRASAWNLFPAGGRNP